MPRDVRVAILGDARDFQRAVRQVQGDAGKLNGAFGGVKRMAAGLGAAFAARELFNLGKGFVDAAIESQKVTKQTDAVIKSMGNTANVSAKQVADLSTSLSLKSGIDDELIQSGSNVLLTFGKIRNEVGKGNQIFDRANAAALDMSVALGTDMTSASMQVGKALNDPVRGLAALRRSGIQFTKQQEQQIKAMVAAGDTAGAQKVMLAELERQFGGSAAAQATATDKLKVAWGNLQEQLGAQLLPIVEKVATWLAANLPRAIEIGKQAFNALRPHIAQVIALVREHWPQIQATITSVMQTVRSVIQGVLSVIQTLWANFGNNILEFVQRVWPRIQQVISGALSVIRGVIQVVTSLIKGDWSGVWNGIKSIVSGVWQAIQGIVGAAIEGLRSVIGIGLEIVGSVFKNAWNGIVGWFSGIPGRVGDIAKRAWEALKRGLKAAVNWIIDQIDRALGPLDELIGKLAGVNFSATGSAFSKDELRALAGQRDSRAQGGVVAGARGQPRLILAHGGEKITQASAVNRGEGGSGPLTVVLQLDSRVLGSVTVDGLKAYNRTNGPIPIRVA